MSLVFIWHWIPLWCDCPEVRWTLTFHCPTEALFNGWVRLSKDISMSSVLPPLSHRQAALLLNSDLIKVEAWSSALQVLSSLCCDKQTTGRRVFIVEALSSRGLMSLGNSWLDIYLPCNIHPCSTMFLNPIFGSEVQELLGLLPCWGNA